VQIFLYILYHRIIKIFERSSSDKQTKDISIDETTGVGKEHILVKGHAMYGNELFQFMGLYQYVNEDNGGQWRIRWETYYQTTSA
jgi:hypothetical protein